MIANNTGEVVFFNGKYGFIRLADERTVFFPATAADTITRQRLRLLDQVSCEISTVTQGLHTGKLIAGRVQRLAAGEPARYQRVVGVLNHQNERSGRVHSPQLSKEVLLFYNRLLDRNAQLTNGELVVFNPVVSSKNAQELFAFFAYPLRQEQDIDFLREQLDASQLPGIQARLDQLQVKAPELSPAEKFAVGLRQLGPVQSLVKYQQLAELIQIAVRAGYQPDIARLRHVVTPVYQIMLWDNQLVADYLPEVMTDYFMRASADRKREIATRLTTAQRRPLLEQFVQQLAPHGRRITRVNNSLKTCLDIIYRSAETRDAELYQQLVGLLEVSPEDGRQLLAQGYIAHLPPSSVAPVDSQKPSAAWLQRHEAEKHPQRDLAAFYQEEMLGADTEDEAGQLRLALVGKLLKEFCPEQAAAFFAFYWPRLSPKQQLILWTVEVGPELPNPEGIYAELGASLSVFFRLRYYLRQPAASPAEHEVAVAEVARFASFYYQHELVEIIRELTPKDAVLPSRPYYRLLDELDELAGRWPGLWDMEEAALAIYQAIPPYQPAHIRLYLSDRVPSEIGDFYGYREPFRLLNTFEKQLLRQRFNRSGQAEEVYKLKLEVTPCETYELSGAVYRYTAFLENIFFGTGSICLRMADGTFTIPYKGDAVSEKADLGINRLPIDSIYSEVPITIWVEGERIIRTENLAALFDLIQEEQIAFVFQKRPPTDSDSSPQTEAYAEDWQLRSEVIHYLKENSLAEYEVTEPRNYFRRLDIESVADEYEKTSLFIIPTADGLGIVWENMDFSEDRSTYVFKARPEELEEQVARLKLAISSYALWRSALTSQQVGDNPRIFRNYFGFLARIRKRRGRNQSFDHWHERLQNMLARPVPLRPSAEEWEQARHSPLSSGRVIPHSSRPPSHRTPRKVKVIDVASLDTVDMETFIRQPGQVSAPTSATTDPRNGLLATLRTFNNFFCADLPAA